jgi:predicted ester cyclase
MSVVRMIDVHTHNKALIAPLRQAMYNFDEAMVRAELERLLAPDAIVHMAHPMGDMIGPQALYDNCYKSLFAALPDLERRDYIVMAGPTEHGDDWVGCGGYYSGVFVAPWLDIPPTGHLVHMRFHEFYRIADGKVIEIQALWDIPEVMMQSNAWPMTPSLGREWHVPGPATQDGLVPGPFDETRSIRSCAHIVDMLEFMKRHPAEGGPEVMQMECFWHPRMNWYGPAGIGTGRGIEGFRNWHQIPFLAGMPDRGQYVGDITYHFFADGDYAAVTGWPNMIQTLTHDGWMGIAPSGKRITLCSLDFWRIEDGLIRENWVLVDLLSAYQQLGVDVFARLREFNKARNLGPIALKGGQH